MSLRTKTLLTIGIVFLIAFNVLSFGLRQYIVDNFLIFGKRDTENVVHQAKVVLENELDTLENSCSDWAWWDDTYFFVTGQNPDYIKDNLNGKALINLNIDLMVFLDAEGNVVYDIALAPGSNDETRAPESLRKHIHSGSPLIKHVSNREAGRGIIVLPESPVMVVALPVLQNDESGPSPGTLIFGRFLSPDKTAKIAAANDLSLLTYGLDSPELPDEIKAEVSDLSPGQVRVRDVASGFYAGYTVLTDIYGKPSLVLQVDLFREVYAQAQIIGFFIMLTVTISALCFIGGLLFFLEKMVLQPVSRLNNSVSRIGDDAPPDERIAIRGRDEIAGLGSAINGMLDRLADSGRELKASEEKYRNVIEDASELIQSVSPDGRFIYVNQVWLDTLGYSRGELPGLTMFNIIDPATQTHCFELFRKVLGGERVQNLETVFVTKSGRKVMLEGNASPCLIDGKVVATQGIFRDITDRKKAEEALQRSEEKYRNLVENAPVGISLITLDGRVLERNRAAVGIYGFESKEDLLKCTAPQRYFDRRDRQRFLEIVKTGAVRNFEVRMKKKDGTVFWESLSAIPQMTEYGPGIITIGQDITQRKMAEDALQTSEKLYRSLFENMLNGFAYCRMLFEGDVPQDFIYLNVNAAFETLTGLKNVVGKRVSEIIPGVRQSDPHLFEIYGRVALTGVPEQFEIYLKGLGMWFSISVYSPQKEYFVAVFDVITERKNAEEELKRRLEFEKAIYNISSGFVGTQDVNSAVENTLSEIGRLCGATRTFIFLTRKNDGADTEALPWQMPGGATYAGDVMDETYEWYAPDVGSRKAKLQGLVCRDYPWWMNKLANGETINITDVSALPPEARAEKAILDAVGAKSILAMPLYIEGRLSGFMGVNNTARPGEWKESDFTTLRVASEIIGNALERQKVEAELRESELSFRSLFETMAQGAVYQDATGRVVSMNAAAEKILGLSSEEMEGGAILNIPRRSIREDGTDFPRETHPFRLALDSGEEVHDVIMGIFNHRDKAYRWIKFHSRPVFRQGSSEPVSVYSTFEDITALKRMEQVVRTSEAKYRNLVEYAPIGISVSTPEGRVIERNRAVWEIYGYASKEEFLKAPSQVRYADPKDRDRLLARLERGLVHDFEVQLRRRDGTPFWASLTVIPQVTESGEKRFVTIMQDIDVRKKAEEQLTSLYQQVKTFNTELEQKIKERTGEIQLALATAEAASKAKSDFLSNMSHELRTPLTAVIGFSQMLQEEYFGALNERQKEYVRDILEAGEHLLTLINDVLDLAKVEAGKMTLDLSGFDAEKLVDETLMLVTEKALKHDIRIETVFPGAGDTLAITADRLRTKQVLLNLLSNAVKFTPDGGKIIVDVGRAGNDIEFSVTDTGIGIDPEYQKRIFETFFQAKSNVTDKTPGTGLGLALCKRFVEMHGGKIRFTSPGSGQGTRFTFTLPVAPLSVREGELENEQDSACSRR